MTSFQTYPAGGIVRSETDPSQIGVFDTLFRASTYTPSGNDVLAPAGRILARITSTGKLVDYDVTGGAAGTEIPVGVLASNVQADGSASDQEIRYITAGQVDESLLSILAGDTITDVIRDLMEEQGIFPINVKDFTKFDNA